MFWHKKRRPLQHLTDYELRLVIVQEKVREAKLLQVCLEIERRLHLEECHGRKPRENGKPLSEMRVEAWHKWERAYSGWDGTPLPPSVSKLLDP